MLSFLLISLCLTLPIPSSYKISTASKSVNAAYIFSRKDLSR
ncbi:hypothetical protein GLYMA_14G083850v4 [Glycine max]|nr:hypothetical protein GLYMA_14G083850v4 [Glycine max]KAH1093666.1 hypothetical protein GYH30_039409 [Glycine max]